MSNIINKILYNKILTKKAWIINGIKTDPKKTETDDEDLSDIENVEIKLIISKEKGFNDIMITISAEDNEYSFLLYDEVLNHIDILRNKKTME